MAVDPVPWFVQAPAEHSAEVARTLAYQALGGREGLAREGDLFVQALPVPGGAVQVLPGAAGILNRGSGGGGQAYVGRVGSAVTVPIATTGSGAGRSDLIVFRVQDPQYGGAVPASAEAGPYIFLDVISGVPAGTTRLQSVPGHEADSAVTLARVDMPASTGTVLNTMITNVSSVANPRRMDVNVYRSLNPGEGGTLSVAAGSTALWPPQARVNTFPVRVPEWASVAAVRASWGGVSGMAGRCWGTVFVTIGSVSTQRCNFVSADTAGEKPIPMRASDTVAIPASIRGTVQNVQLWAAPASPPGTSRPVVGEYGSVDLDIAFYEHPSQITGVG